MTLSGDARETNEPAAAPAAWRGSARSNQTADGRTWQRGATVQPLTQLRLQEQGRRLRVAGLLLLLGALSALWIYSLLFQAVQTPLVVVAATDYDWPLPPNAWVREDLDRLGDLHGKTLYLMEAEANWNIGEHALRDFQEKISAAVTRRSGASALLIYISMHGVVDGDGVPCLIPPGGSPLDSGSWVPIRAVLGGLKSLSKTDDLDKILILDCNRMQTNWRLGLLYNGFADRLPEVVQQSGIRNLAVLNSTGPGQVGWCSPQLQGSAFGYYLRRALAGEADGDGDRRISVDELHRYLAVNVNGWAVRNRAARQEPILIAEEAMRQHAIAWVPARGVPLRPLPGKPEVSQEELGQLWKDHDLMLSRDALRFAPLEFQTFQNRLLWLEQSNQAGAAYNKYAGDLREGLRRSAAAWKQRESVAANSDTVAARRRIWDPETENTAASLTPHSLPLATYFGRIDENPAAALREAWQQFGSDPEPATELDPTGLMAEGGSKLLLTESVFRRLAQRQLAWTGGETSTDLRQVFAAVFAALEQGELVAVPEDERVLPWIRGSVAEGDRLRRAAEDASLAGAFQQALENSRLAEQAYGRAEEFTNQVADAFRVRDQVSAKVPYLAEWVIGASLFAPLRISATESSPRLTRLIQNLLTLGEQLSEPEADFVYVTSDTVPFTETLQAVHEDFDWLQTRFDLQVQELLKPRQAAPENLRKIQALLATPWMDASRRLALRDRLSSLDATLCQSKEIAATGPVPSAGEEPAGDYLTWLQRHWTPHPATQLLQPNWLGELLAPQPAAEKETAAPSATDTRQKEAGIPAALALAEAGARLRGILRELPSIDRGRDLAALPDGTTPAGGDSGWRAASVSSSRRDRLARLAAAWWAPPLNCNPVARRRRFDQQGLLLWHSERVLRDFRGPPAGQGESFFRIAARDYLQGATLFGASSPAPARRRDELQAKLQQAKFGLEMEVENVLLIDAADPLQTRVHLRPGETRAGLDLVRGTVALFVRSGGRQLPDVQFVTSGDNGIQDSPPKPPSNAELAFPLAETRIVQMKGAGLTGAGPRLEVVAAFRGHEFAASCLVQTMGGVTVEYAPPTDPRTRILVQGTRRQRKSFVFVLDCSNSMQQATGVEATDGDRIACLQVAKQGLQGMLDQLAEEPDTRVGVRFFGHRVGWSTAEPVRALRRKDYVRPIPLDLAPSEDVELILPLGRFDSLLAGQVGDLLASVKPWGQTPLYRALVEAIDDFERDDPDTEKHIIVITDGVNYQFTPSASGPFAAPRPTSIDDVVSAWSKQKPTIHLVGFGIPEPEAAAAERDYRELIERTPGGTYQTSAAEVQVLLRKLDQLLAKATYQVLDASGKQVGVPIQRDGGLAPKPGTARLGESLEIQPRPVAPGDYTVACQQLQESILLRGGEAAEFELSADGRRLKNSAYPAGSPRFGPLIVGAGGPPFEYQFGVHRPVNGADGVRFEFSLQHPQQRFTPRPAEIWIEVTPLDTDGKPATSAYTFYDAVFASDVPVPVIRWSAKGWPVGSATARVNCWFKPTTTPANVIVDASRITPAPASRLSFAEFPDVGLQMDSISSGAGKQIRVVEWHGENAAGVGSLKVDLAPPANSGLQPRRVIRTFDPQHRVAAHVFTLPGDAAQTLAGWEIRLTTAASSREGAIQLADPVEVRLAENADQLTPLPSLNGQ